MSENFVTAQVPILDETWFRRTEAEESSLGKSG